MARSGSTTARAAVVLAAAALLSGCAGPPPPAASARPSAPAPSSAPSATPFTSDAGSATSLPSISPTPAPTPTPTAASTRPSSTPSDSSIASAAPEAAATGVIGFGSIGRTTIARTAKQIAADLDATVRSDAGNPSCATATFAADGSGEDAVLAGALSTLAASDGATGRVDVLELGVLRPVDRSAAARLPKTERGIGIGSALAQVRAAYRGDLAVVDGYPGFLDAVIDGPRSTALVLHLQDGVVSGISTGRLPQVRFAEHCG